jgi:hypothetical protein
MSWGVSSREGCSGARAGERGSPTDERMRGAQASLITTFSA